MEVVDKYIIERGETTGNIMNIYEADDAHKVLFSWLRTILISTISKMFTRK